MAQPLFGKKLEKAILQEQANKQLGIGKIVEYVANLCFVSPAAVQKWRSSSLPNDRENVKSLAIWGVREVGMDRSWLTEFLEAADYVDGGALDRGLFDDYGSELSIEDITIPPLSKDFIGRDAEVRRVLEGLLKDYRLVLIQGMSGIGKTRLAQEIVRLCMEDSLPGFIIFKEIVWVAAANIEDGQLTLNDVLNDVAAVLGLQHLRRFSADYKRPIIEQKLRENRILIVVDSYEMVNDDSLLNFLQFVPPPSRAIITTRWRLQQHHWSVPLTGLTPDETLKKIRNVSHSLSLPILENADDNVLRPLVEITAGNPKAIELALGYIKYEDMALDRVIKGLHEANLDLEDLFAHLFARAWYLLPQEGKRLLSVMPFFSGSVGREALSVAAGVHGDALRKALVQLINLSLLESNGELREDQIRYSAHPLVLAFARARLKERPDFEPHARERWAKHSVEFAAHYIKRDKPESRYFNALMQNKNIPQIVQEWPNLRKVLVWADEHDQDHLLIELTIWLVHFLDRRMMYDDRRHFAHRAADAAHKTGDYEAETLLRIDALGWTYMEEGNFDDAICEITKGLHVAKKLAGDKVSPGIIALGYAFLTLAYLNQGNNTKAAELIAEAVDVDCAPEFRSRIMMAAGETADSYTDYLSAITYYKKAIDYSQQYDNEGLDIDIHYRLGNAFLAQGDLDSAKSEFIEVLRNEAFSIEPVHAKAGLARVAEARGDIVEACRFAQEAYDQLEQYAVHHKLLKILEDYIQKLGCVNLI